MINIRRSQDRGHFNHGWLDTYHTFSFGDYRDPKHMHFRSLRVINEDRVAAGQGFGMHPHSDMEIVTYVISGALEHRDSMGNGEVLRPGEVQRMTAGTGILHSEFNPSPSDPVHLLQIWILPERNGIAPSYEQKPFADSDRRNSLRIVASRDGRDDSVTIHQDASIYAATLEQGKSVRHEFAPGRSGWLQMIRGEVALNGDSIHAGDGAAISDEGEVVMAASEDAEFLLFDLA